MHPLYIYNILIHSFRYWSKLMSKYFIGVYDLGSRSEGWGKPYREKESIKNIFHIDYCLEGQGAPFHGRAQGAT